MDGMAERGDLPILQDTTMTDAWTQWAVAYRDVWVLDARNQKTGVINLTVSSLERPENVATLEALVLGAAGR